METDRPSAGTNPFGGNARFCVCRYRREKGTLIHVGGNSF
jgi:hypothetical protein